MNQLSPATRYFIQYWEDLWTGFSSQEDLLKSFNPRVVIQELRDEVTLNKQKNISNEKFFNRILGGYSRTDPGAKGRLKIHLQMILTELNVSTHRPKYLPLLCDSALKVFDKFEYFEDCLVAMEKLTHVATLTVEQKQEIQLIVNHLIVELRCIGYADKEIHRMPSDLFSSSKKTSATLYWAFPHQQICDDWQNPEAVKAYEARVLAFENSLKEIDRLLGFLTIAKQEATPIKFIFPVNGMTGTMSVNVGDVLFYSPEQNELSIESSTPDRDEEKMFNSGRGKDVVNATVVVDAVSPSAGEAIARSRVEKAFSISRRILYGKAPLWLGRSHLAIDENGVVISSSSHTFERPEDDIFQKFNLHPKKQPQIQARLTQIEMMQETANANGWGRRFDEACYWLRKAEESSNYVEKLLSYWICVESLCAKSDNISANWLQTKSNEKETDIYLIREIVGKSIAIARCYQFGWTLRSCINSRNNRWKGINIPLDLAKRSQLEAADGEQLFLSNLIGCLGEIDNALPEGILKDQVFDLKEFYDDEKVALINLRKYLESAQDEIAFIYRMRNKIAHEGNSEHFLLPSLCKLAEDYALSFFNSIQYRIERDGDKDLQSILINLVQNYDRIELLLKTEKPLSIFLGSR